MSKTVEKKFKSNFKSSKFKLVYIPAIALLLMGNLMSACVISTPADSSPLVSYLGATGTSGFIGKPMNISPSSLKAYPAITQCVLQQESGSAASWPSELTINPTTCVISGIPKTSMSNTTFTVLATNSAGTSETANVTFSIDNCDVTGSPMGYGDGTSDSPYSICSAEQLANVHNFPAAHFQLRGSIDLTTASLTPIGSVDNPFQGTFDGNGFTLSNWIYSQPSDYVGLFGVTGASGVTTAIKNLTLSGFIVTGNSFVGALVGDTSGGDTHISNCVVNGSSITGAKGVVGGMVGRLYDHSSITDSAVENMVVTSGFSSSILGGLVGLVDTAGSITHSHSSGIITGLGLEYVGGLVGQTSTRSNVISKSYSSMNLDLDTTSTTIVGGLIGEASYVSVSDSYVSGKVSGGQQLGGLIGSSNHGGVTLTNCYSSATITDDGTGTSGGLIANMGGYPFAETSCYWDVSVTEPGYTTSAGTEMGETTSQMQGLSSEANFAGWDFSDTWLMKEGSYPTLR